MSRKREFLKQTPRSESPHERGSRRPSRRLLFGVAWLAWAGLVSALLSGCGPAAEPDKDAGKAPASGDPAPASPTVVSLSPGATRFVFALGAEPLLLGVDADSRALPGTEGLPTLDLATARQVAPDLVLLAASFPHGPLPLHLTVAASHSVTQSMV